MQQMREEMNSTGDLTPQSEKMKQFNDMMMEQLKEQDKMSSDEEEFVNNLKK